MAMISDANPLTTTYVLINCIYLIFLKTSVNNGALEGQGSGGGIRTRVRTAPLKTIYGNIWR